jgi:putative membrane protein
MLALLLSFFALVVYRGFGLGRPFFVDFGGGLFFGLFSLLLLLIVISFVLRLVFRPWRRGWYGRGRYGRYDPAMQQLRERYARGEITKEQFEQMARDLHQN